MEKPQTLSNIYTRTPTSLSGLSLPISLSSSLLTIYLSVFYPSLPDGDGATARGAPLRPAPPSPAGSSSLPLRDYGAGAPAPTRAAPWNPRRRRGSAAT